MACTLHDWVVLLQDIKTADWSDEVAPFWDAVIRSALTGRGLAGLFKAGWTTLKVCPRLPLAESFWGPARLVCSLLRTFAAS